MVYGSLKRRVGVVPKVFPFSFRCIISQEVCGLPLSRLFVTLNNLCLLVLIYRGRKYSYNQNKLYQGAEVFRLVYNQFLCKGFCVQKDTNPASIMKREDYGDGDFKIFL